MAARILDVSLGSARLAKRRNLGSEFKARDRATGCAVSRDKREITQVALCAAKWRKPEEALEVASAMGDLEARRTCCLSQRATGFWPSVPSNAENDWLRTQPL
jgi:hypothetical protein